MKTSIQTALDNVGGDRAIGNTGWTMGEALMATAAAQLDEHRFGVDGQAFVESILARYGEGDGALYPEAAELAAAGADLFALNNASANGLDMAAFGEACEDGLDVKTFTAALNRGLDPAAATDLLGKFDALELNGHLANFVEAHDEHEQFPNHGDRVLMALDGDRVEWLN